MDHDHRRPGAVASVTLRKGLLVLLAGVVVVIAAFAADRTRISPLARTLAVCAASLVAVCGAVLLALLFRTLT